MTDIKNLSEAQAQPVQEVVEELETALEHAKRGDLVDIVIVGTKRGGDGFTAFSTHNVFRLISLCELLKFDLLKAAKKLPEDI